MKDKKEKSMYTDRMFAYRIFFEMFEEYNLSFHFFKHMVECVSEDLDDLNDRLKVFSKKSYLTALMVAIPSAFAFFVFVSIAIGTIFGLGDIVIFFLAGLVVFLMTSRMFFEKKIVDKNILTKEEFQMLYPKYTRSSSSSFGMDSSSGYNSPSRISDGNNASSASYGIYN